MRLDFVPQVKDAANELNEEEKDRKMMSDSASITDANYQQLMPAKAAWLVLFYSDDSDDSWDLHPTWERVVDELRELQVPFSSFDKIHSCTSY